MISEVETDIVIACCRDEEDLICKFIDFYIDMGFDYICLVDNGSQDDTVARILAHPAHERISLLIDSRPGYDQRLLEYYRAFESRATRWCFFVDVDEFVLIPGGIKQYATSISKDATVIRLRTAEMLPLTPATLHPLSSEQREANFQREDKVVWKCGPVQRIACGKHSVDIEPYIEHQDPSLFIRHYHTRSPLQFRRKLLNRIQTEETFTDAERERLSVFSREHAERWVDYSRQMLGSEGWQLETERLNRIPVVSDKSIKLWLLSRQINVNSEHLSISPTIPLRIRGKLWHCFCVHEQRNSEGHTGAEHLVLLLGNPHSSSDGGTKFFDSDQQVYVRIHSECLFGDVFDSERCDCGLQLSQAISLIEEFHCGVVVYLRQEGRGVGLYDKIRSLTIENPDSFARNEQLGLPGDKRSYATAAEILILLGVQSVQLISGNPEKMSALTDVGLTVSVVQGETNVEHLSKEAVEDLLTKINRGYFYTVEAPTKSS